MSSSVQEAQVKPYNSRIIDIYLQLIRQKYSYIDINDLLDYAGMKAYQVVDQGHWFTQEQVDRFYERLVQITDNPAIAREAGRFAAFTETGNVFRPYMLGLLGPANAYKVFEKASAYFTKSSNYIVRKRARNKVEITVEAKPGIEEKQYQCENRIGFFEAVASIFELKNPVINHDECIFRGGKRCVYTISWDKSILWKLKRARNIAYLGIGVGNLVGLVLDQTFTLQYILPYSVSLGAILGFTFAYRESISLRKNMRDLKNITEELIQQTRINYNNTLLAHEVGEVTNKHTSSDDIIKEVIRIAENRLDYDRGMIMLANQDRTRLIFKAGFGYIDKYLSLLQKYQFHLDKPESKGAFVVSFKEQRPILVNDIDLIENDLSERSLHFARKLDVRSFICCPIICDKESLGIIAVDNLTSKRPLLQSDMSMLMGIASVIGISLRNAWLMEEREKQFNSLLKVLASSIDARDPMTAGHSERVTAFVTEICKQMGLDETDSESIRISALLHDYGKIGVPDVILKKKGPLSKKEFEIIKTHTGKTKEILDKVQFEGIYHQVPDIASSHHERFDGTGYPNGLSGEEIPLGARIIAVADFYEAVTAMRHYRYPMKLEDAVELLKNQTGSHFDPDVVEAFLCCLEQSRELTFVPV
jgi:HD-GYP domain-containing protein (c-di-GMP phosphodiesterase class II)